MFRCKVAIIGCAIFLSSCAQQLKPLDVSSYTDANDECANNTEIELTICQAHQKSKDLSRAYFDWKNDPAIWDTPLLALATAAAGLLLFDGSTDALKAVGLGAGTIGAGRSYFSPREVQSALLDGSNGYACLGDIGSIVSADKGTIENLKSTRDDLSSNVSSLSELAKATTDNAVKVRLEALVAKAREALQLYDTQAEAAKFSNITMRSKARAISTGLLKRLQRKPVDFTKLYQNLAQSAKTSADFELKKLEAEPPAEQNKAFANTDSGIVTTTEKQLRKLITEIPNITKSIGEFDVCVTNSLAGSN